MLTDETQQPTETQAPAPLSQNYKFNQDELLVLRECNSESFYQRSLPLMTVMGSTIYFGISRGMLKPHAKLGAIPKVGTALVFGYFLGKFSYQQKCMEKLMQLPNSPVGALLRQRYKQGLQVSPTEAMATTFPSFSSAPLNADDRPDNDNFNLDTERPTFAGLEDSFRPSLDGAALESHDISRDKIPTLSYDDLRKRNRESEMKVNPYKLPEIAPPVNHPPPVTAQPKNKYGDVLN